MLFSAPQAPLGVCRATVMDSIAGGKEAGFMVTQTWFECQLHPSAHGHLWQVSFIPWYDEGNNNADLTAVV